MPDPIQELVLTARRNQILDAATQVFASKGFHRATIKDIARVASIADGTIYTYFASKTDVLLGILNRLNESAEREQQLNPQQQQDFRSFFTAYLRQRMSLFWPNAEVFQAVLPEMLANAELRDVYYQQVITPTFAISDSHGEVVSRTRRPDWRCRSLRSPRSRGGVQTGHDGRVYSGWRAEGRSGRASERVWQLRTRIQTTGDC